MKKTITILVYIFATLFLFVLLFFYFKKLNIKSIYFNFLNKLDKEKSYCINQDTNPVASSAIFEWYQKPASIRFVGKYDRTYISWVSSTGKIQIRYYDNKKNAFSGIYTVDDLYPKYKVESQDDHNAPTLLILPDGRLLIFYVVHDKNNAFFMKKSTQVEDISSWSKRKNISDPGINVPYNYPQARLLDNGNIFLLYRRGIFYNSDEYYKISINNGETWESPNQLIDFGNEGIYSSVFTKKSSIHIAWNEYVDESPRKSIYYMYSPDGGETWKKRNGSPLTLPVKRDTAEMVFDAKDDPASVWDIVVDDNNNPFIVFAYKKDPFHEFRFAQWNGTSWKISTITSSSLLYTYNNYFSGGIVIDPKKIYSVFLSKKREHLEIERWISVDKGKTWKKEESVTKDSGVDNFRMQLVENGTDKLRLVWASGLYEGLTNDQWTGFSKVNIQSDITKSSIPNRDCDSIKF